MTEKGTTDNAGTLRHALEIHEKTVDRVCELMKVQHALGPDNKAPNGVHCIVCVAQGTAWAVELSITKDVARLFFEAELAEQRDALHRMDMRLAAARKAMQQETVP